MAQRDDDWGLWVVLTVGTALGLIVMICNPPRYAEPKFQQGEVVSIIVGNKTAMVKEVNNRPLPDVPAYMVSYEDKMGEIHDKYLSEFELEKFDGKTNNVRRSVSVP